MQYYKLTLLAAASAVSISSDVIADHHAGDRDGYMKDDQSAMAEHAQTNTNSMDVGALDDHSWVTFSGTITGVAADTFMLDYGNGELVVEVDDGDFDNDAYKFVEGDKVTVTGRVDENLFTQTTIEASSIYVENINTTFFSSAIDEEESYVNYASTYRPMAVDTVVLIGNVLSTSEVMDHIDIRVGGNTLEIDVSELDDNPLDENGYLKVMPGDRIKVTATIDEGFFAEYNLEATSLMRLGS